MYVCHLCNSLSHHRVVVGRFADRPDSDHQAHLYVVKEDGDPSLRQWALSLLIEDRMDQLPSYNQWIGQLKDKVS